MNYFMRGFLNNPYKKIEPNKQEIVAYQPITTLFASQAFDRVHQGRFKALKAHGQQCNEQGR
ncbi:hypothetical protein GCM10027577_46580 [Spirosoma fluminis]